MAELFIIHCVFFSDCVGPVCTGVSVISQGQGDISLRKACFAEDEVSSLGLRIFGEAERELKVCAGRQDRLGCGDNM